MTAEHAADDAPIEEREPRGRRRLTGWKGFLRDVVVILLAAIVVSFLIKTFLIRSFFIPSESMQDTLQVNDRIIVNELVPDLVPIQHGDVVVFRDPGGWLSGQPQQPDPGPVVGFFEWLGSFVGLTAPDSDDHLIKRVIGMPGDTVVCCDEFDQLVVNGVPIDEPYVTAQAGDANAFQPFEVTVPEDSLWVMGDNRGNSQDSRFHQDLPGGGFVPYDDVVGRAFVISWPTSRWTWLDNYPVVWADVREQG
jgi:signal peptidase I